MIFACDLDRTLIYSEKFCQGYTGQVQVVEFGKYNSYMTARALVLLRQIAGKMTFVPCTTRSVEQYRRIQLARYDVVNSFAVVSNGANILIDGIPNVAYREHIQQLILNNCLAGQDLLNEFHKLAGAWAKPMQEADGVFHYCIIDRAKAPLNELASFSDWARKQRWEVSMQGRKLYLIPQFVNKWSALRKIAALVEDHRIIAAGDSLLDLPLILGAEYAVSPAHGELFEQYGHREDVWNFTNTSGIMAGEEILNTVLMLNN